MQKIYWLVLGAIGLWVLVLFLTPSGRHSGLNSYAETHFPTMVQGTAYKPFVARTFLPSTVRILTQFTPSALREWADGTTEKTPLLRQGFDRFGWEYNNSVQYYFAALLMWLSFVGFAHFTVLLVCQQLEWPAVTVLRAILGGLALLGLPALFKYSSFAYDPSQLFLFSLALYLLASKKARWFRFVFILCCLSKETALLLIPLYITSRWDQRSTREFKADLGYLLASYAIIKGSLIWAFRNNPGSFVEVHLLGHNLDWFLHDRQWEEIAVILGIAALVFFRWNQKPRFLRQAFLVTVPIIAGSSLVFGFVDEWRIYYEAYPIVFALIVASLPWPRKSWLA